MGTSSDWTGITSHSATEKRLASFFFLNTCRLFAKDLLYIECVSICHSDETVGASQESTSTEQP